MLWPMPAPRGLIDIGLQFTLVLRGLRRDLVRIINLLVTMTAEPIETIIYLIIMSRSCHSPNRIVATATRVVRTRG